MTASTSTVAFALPSSGVYGQSIQLSAQVSSGGGTPTGTVAFTVGATTLGSAPLTGGSASINTTAIPVGNQTITATYTSADSNFSASSGTTPVNIAKASSAIDILTQPSTVGQAASFTITVGPVPPGFGTPTGSVTVNFSDGTSATAALTLGKVNVDHVYAAAGSYFANASYSGNSNFTASASRDFPQQVNQASSSTALQSCAQSEHVRPVGDLYRDGDWRLANRHGAVHGRRRQSGTAGRAQQRRGDIHHLHAGGRQPFHQRTI